MIDALLKEVENGPLVASNYWRLAQQYLLDGEYEKGRDAVKHSLSLAPSDPVAWSIYGAFHNLTGQFDKAKPCLDRALQISPNLPSARWNRYWANLALGNYGEAWEDQEFGFLNKLRHLRVMGNEWRGEDLAGKTVFVWGEQGLGDQIQFVRYLKYLRQMGARIILEVHLPLVRLFEHLADEVVARPDNLENGYYYDYQIPLQSLPLALWRHRDIKEIPNEPYIHIEGDGGEIGFCWKGSPGHPNDHNRSLTSEEAMIMEGKATMALCMDAPFEMADGTGPDLLETARNMARCKLIVTIDSAIAHLAGAMGLPTIMIPPLNGEGRWGIDGHGTVWYPSMQLARPETFEKTLTEIREQI